SLVPLYSGNYHGTQQVEDLIGGGTLFQESQDHVGSLKLIRSFSNGLKLKAVGSYGAEFLRETVDESWGDGLYDNRRAAGGAEAEWSWAKDRYVRLAYDYYAIRFPNYTSLESQGAVLGLGREFNAPDVLDTHNHAVTLGSEIGLPGNGFLDASAAMTWSSFGSQHLVDLSGELTPDVRHDQDTILSAQGTWPLMVRPDWRLFSSLGFSWNHLLSDQNHYDAGQTFFNPNYYSYVTQTLQNQWTMLFGQDNPWSVNLNWSLARQQYSDRLVQNNVGAYGTDITRVDSASVGLGFTYPIAKGFRLSATTTFGWSNSNNEDNLIYQYHYHTANYLMGFTYAY
ncbi:MAG TPA: hypothetical protein VMU17_05430, partial [Elusimicrobiota bacterium]|nr:hypothetical protein [Elusimicrobiota bacterium]